MKNKGYKLFQSYLAANMLIFVLSGTITAQSTLTLPDLLSSRFDPVFMSCTPEQCEIRDCAIDDLCTEAITTQQLQEIENRQEMIVQDISEVRSVPCRVGNATVYEDRYFLDLTKLLLPAELIRIRICNGSEHYLFASEFSNFPSPVEVVQRIHITSYQQTFEVVNQGQTESVSLEGFLNMIFYDEVLEDQDVVTGDYVGCGEVRCEPVRVDCTNEESIAQENIIEYLQNQASNIDPSSLSYPQNIYSVALCGGKSLWLLEDEKLFLDQEGSIIEILQSLQLDNINTDITLNSPCFGSLYNDDIKVTHKDPSCDVPTSGEILITLEGDAVNVFSQFSIDGGDTYQSNPVFQGLEDGGYFVVVANDDLSIVHRENEIVKIQNPCLENDKETCSDGIDNDGDGLLDCDDEDCNNTTICNSDILCDLFNRIEVGFFGLSTIHVDFDSLFSIENLSKNQILELLEDVEMARFIFDQDVFFFNDPQSDTMNVRLQFLKTHNSTYYREYNANKLVSVNTEVKRELKMKDVEGLDESAIEICRESEIFNNINCDFSIGMEVCGQSVDHYFLHLSIDGPPSPNYIVSIYSSVDSSGLSLLESQSNGTRTYPLKSSNGPQLIQVIGPSDCVVEMIIPSQSDTTPIVNLGLNECLYLSEINETLECSIVYDPLCLMWLEPMPSGMEVTDENCLRGENSGLIKITYSIGGQSYTQEIFVIVNDNDRDGILNNHDPDVDNDGDPNGMDDDIDGDGILNSDDDDMDGDGIDNENDDVPDGTDTEDCTVSGLGVDEDGDGLFDCDDPDCDNNFKFDCAPCDPFHLPIMASMDTICVGGKVNLNAYAPPWFNAIYMNWSNGESMTDSIDVRPTVTTTYKVLYKFFGKCPDSSMITIVVRPRLNWNVETVLKTTVSSDSLWCKKNWADSSIVIRMNPDSLPSGNYTYKWSDGSTADTLKVTPDTSKLINVYYVDIMQGGSCFRDSIIIKMIDCPCPKDMLLNPLIAVTVARSGGAPSASNSLGGLYGCRRTAKRSTCAVPVQDTIVSPTGSIRIVTRNKRHRGLDVEGALGEKVHSMYEGYVQRIVDGCLLYNTCDTIGTKCAEALGNQVAIVSEVSGGDSIRIIYGHLTSIVPGLKDQSKDLTKNSFVRQGQVIGYLGQTGNACKSWTIPHVHVATRTWVNNNSSSYIDPSPFLATQFKEDATVDTTHIPCIR